ncbi:unnamed protein product [marine sediment metagenome]|uniref:Uncharacterized protein n=1 Tax=marine sediment metagenome TaxID=412755 RepID=X1RK39_9ZZZZ
MRVEGYLNAWFMREFSAGNLKDIIGEYRDFLDFVPTSFNTVMDIFLTHVTTLDSVDILHKFTCIELKTGLSLLGFILLARSIMKPGALIISFVVEREDKETQAALAFMLP